MTREKKNKWRWYKIAKSKNNHCIHYRRDVSSHFSRQRILYYWLFFCNRSGQYLCILGIPNIAWVSRFVVVFLIHLVTQINSRHSHTTRNTVHTSFVCVSLLCLFNHRILHIEKNVKIKTKLKTCCRCFVVHTGLAHSHTHTLYSVVFMYSIQH